MANFLNTTFLSIITLMMPIIVKCAMVDLTHYLDNNTIYWPGHRPWEYEIRRFNWTTISNFTTW